MKKRILIFAAVGTALMLAACSSSSTTATTAAPAETTAAETTAAPAETTAAETTAAPAETTAEETTEAPAETTAEETTEAPAETTEAPAETTEAETETEAPEEETKVDLEALLEVDEEEIVGEDNILAGLWVLEDDPTALFCFTIYEDSTFVFNYESGASEGAFEMTGENTAEGTMDGEPITFSLDAKKDVLTIETSEALMEFVRNSPDLEMQAAYPFVDYWYVNGNTEKGYILFNEDQTMEVLNSEGTLQGTWEYEDGILTATVNDEAEKFKLTDDDILIPEPDDGTFQLIRGSDCDGLTLAEEGNRGMGQDVVIQGVDANHTKARNYDVEAAVTYPDDMEYYDIFYDAVCAGGTYSDTYVVVRNVTDWWSTFPGYNEDLLREYAQSYIRDDFVFLYGNIEGETEEGARANGNGNCLATFSANYWNGSNDILVKSALYELTYQNGGDQAYIVKTAYVPIYEDSMMDYVWSEVKASGCRHTYG